MTVLQLLVLAVLMFKLFYRVSARLAVHLTWGGAIILRQPKLLSS